jgi:DNA ligase-1
VIYELVITHGQDAGSLQESRERVEEGKNVGRANETTPEEQAEAQADSRWKKQLDRHYRETIEEAQKAAKKSTNPMLAHKWAEKAHKLEEGQRLVVQPKLDGMRCLARKEDGVVYLLSRGGKAIESVPHINRELEAWMLDGETWDGELYRHDTEFEELISICKRSVKNMHPSYAMMQFHIFDVVDDAPYFDRITVVKERFNEKTGFMLQVVNSETIEYEGEDQLRALTERFEKAGYEGIILRNVDMPYEHKRSIQLLKVKTFHDEEYKIIGAADGKKGSRKEGLLQCFIMEGVNTQGKTETFKGALLGSEEKLREMWERRGEYVGELATVVFQEKTRYGIPRFPKVKAIRGKEDLS